MGRSAASSTVTHDRLPAVNIHRDSIRLLAKVCVDVPVVEIWVVGVIMP